MARVYFLTGGNLGNREQILTLALAKMTEEIGTLYKVSSIYETAPWGFEHEKKFLNQVIVLESEYSPVEILYRLQNIEICLGRLHKGKGYNARTIDIDILFYDNLIISSERLTIPHPRIQERMFVLMPLQEILSDFVHPVLKKSISELYHKCRDKLEVKKYK